MGIRFYCPNGHKLNVKEFQAGQRGICPKCHAKFDIPFESTREAGSKDLPIAKEWEARARKEGLFPFDQNKKEIALDDINLNAFSSDYNTVPGYTGISQSAQELRASVNSQVQRSVQKPTVPAAPPAAPAPKRPDPFEGSADIVWYVRPSSGEQLGPLDRDVVKRWLGENRIAPDTLVWREGWSDWKNASDVFEQLAGKNNAFGF